MSLRRVVAAVLLAIGLAAACAFDTSLREFLTVQFWLPFAKHSADFEKRNVRRTALPYAGMSEEVGDSPLVQLRSGYRRIASPDVPPFDPAPFREKVAAARAVRSLTRREKEEVELIDAKVDMRADLLESSTKKLEAFLRTARTPELLSEARGWLARVHYLSGNQTAAGKIYLDELNRNGSNLSREALLNSLQMNYGYDGGPQLLAHLEEYFDTPEHAAFAIQLITNPHWHRFKEPGDDENPSQSYARIKDLLEKHNRLLHSNGALPLLAMRTALRMGDTPGARKIAESIPDTAAVRSAPDFQWMLGSIYFLSRDYAAAEMPLLATLADFSVYWASSGWDLSLLLEAEAPIEALQSFIAENPKLPEIRLVKYSVAVRLARDNRYDEAADLYQSTGAMRRAARMRRLAVLHREATSGEARYRLAEFLSANSNGIYFNDVLWEGMQRYAFQASTDSRLTRAEREAQIASERKLKDDQEELWRAYLMLRDVVRDAGRIPLGRRAATLAVGNLRRISERFGREDEIRKADTQLSNWLLHR